MELSTNETDGDIVIETAKCQDLSTGKEELFLNRNLKCFLCQRISHGEGNAENERMGKVCLRKICHYLNVKKDKCDYSVEVCANCESVCNSLSGLVHQLEMTKMLIQDRLYQFNQILMNCGVKLDEKEDEELRNATRNKSTIKLKEMMNNSFPKVKLCRTSTSTAMVHIQETPLQAQWSDICTSPKQWVSNIFQKLVPNRHRYPCPFCKILVSEQIIRSHLLLGHSEKYFDQKLRADVPVDNVKRICQQHLLIEVSTAKKGNCDFECQYCHLKFNNEVRFKCHFLLTHFGILEEKLIHQEDWISIQKKSQTISNERKRKDVREMNINVKRTKTLNTDTISSSALETIKNNISAPASPVEEHIEPEVDMASPSTTTTTSEKILKFREFCNKLIKTSESNDHINCVICNNSYTTQTTDRLRRHLVNSHAEQFFPEEKRKFESLSDQQFKMFCRKFLRHETKISKTFKKTSTDIPSYPSRSQTHLCKICKEIKNCGNDFRLHLVMEHVSVMKKKLIQFVEGQDQETSQPAKIKKIASQNKIKGDPLADFTTSKPEFNKTSSKLPQTSLHLLKRTSALNSKYNCKKRKPIYDICWKLSRRSNFDEKYQCTVCNMIYPSKRLTRLQRHQVNSHPEKFFSQKNLEINGPLPEEVFVEYCRKLLAQETINLSKSVKSFPGLKALRNRIHQCKICLQIKHGGNDFRFHLMMDHCDVLEKKLAIFINNENKNVIVDDESDQSTSSIDEVEEEDDNYDHVTYENNLPAEPEVKGTDDRILLTSEDNTSGRLSTSKSVDSEAKRIVYEICLRFSKRTESGSHYECTICNVLFPVSHLMRLRRHIANCHPEKFFDREKLQPNMSEDLFISCCRKVMGQVTKKSQLPYETGSRSLNLVCKNCKRKFFGGHDFKYHQILEHGERLEEMMRECLNVNGNEKIGGNEGLSNCKKRGRGRPPKKNVNDGGGKGLMVGLKKRGRGRPRKIRNEIFEDLPNEDITESKPIIIDYETESLDQDQDNLRNDNLVKVDIVDEVEGREEFGIENNFDMMNYEDDDEPAIDDQHEIGTGTTDSEIDTKLVIKSVMSVPLQMDSILPDNFVNH